MNNFFNEYHSGMNITMRKNLLEKKSRKITKKNRKKITKNLLEYFREREIT